MVLWSHKSDFIQGEYVYVRHNPEVSGRMMFSDLPREEGIKWAARLSIHTVKAFTDPATGLSDEDKKIPITYIHCTEDGILAPHWQQGRIEQLKSESGDVVSVLDLHTGHAPNVSAPAKLVDAIKKAIEGGV
jgi:pimeloyl-ACP methyl ester carboxylesterase